MSRKAKLRLVGSQRLKLTTMTGKLFLGHLYSPGLETTTGDVDPEVAFLASNHDRIATPERVDAWSKGFTSFVIKIRALTNLSDRELTLISNNKREIENVEVDHEVTHLLTS
jgi:hypothetical protein